MSFLQSDDHVIVMNLPTGAVKARQGETIRLTDEEMTRLRDVGVRTVMLYDFWRETAKNGPGYLDTMVSQIQRLGMRGILVSYERAPEGLPAEWYCRKEDGTIGCTRDGFPALSIWNIEAREAIVAHLQEIIDCYGGDNLTVINGGCSDGELVLPRHYPCIYDRAALASHVEHVGRLPDPNNAETLAWLTASVVEHLTILDGFLLKQHNTIWNSMHPILALDHIANGNGAQESVLSTECAKWPDADRYLMQYTYWHHSRNNYKATIARWLKDYGLQMIVEANYCAGLPKTAPLAIAAGFRGQIVHPLAPHLGLTHLEQSNVDVIAAAIRLWGKTDQ